ncbi:MAG: TonB-dependent receptor plug domain-containing protein [Muribaculaceae bacterium]|nr:TonB-dependent receptor plug domain-containing protein [Muribaculaceae bacterium]
MFSSEKDSNAVMTLSGSQADSLDSIARVDSILLADFDRREKEMAEMKGKELGEVVVTARESRGVTTASVINRQAMAHLQPSSFTDLVELLPGFVSKDPDMGSANLINLRQAPQASPDGYDTSSLGTSFVIDGVPVNTTAEMQSTADSNRSGRLTTGKGVDMRSISTDDIESVEIVRGIPSVEYGDLTSGLVKIKRKQGVSGLEARFKADMQSQLFYVGKGFRMPATGWTANLSADYLDSRIDPRDNRQNFKRASFSLRSNLKRQVKGNDLTWDTSLNYTGTFERDKNDPDLTVNNTVDYYTNDINSFSWNNTLVLLSRKGGFFNSLGLTTGLSYADEHLRQQKTVASTRLYPLPVSTVPGGNYVGFLPMLYMSDFDVYGKPFSAFAKFSSRFRYTLGDMSGWLKGGVEWNLSKNFGKGQVYDLTRPLTAGNNSRPRPFDDIPAMQQLSAYVENESEIRLGNHTLHLQLGLRETQLLGLDGRYYLSGRPYLDPRANLKWTLPYLSVAGEPMVFEIGGGAGLHTKMPVAAYLYPGLLFTDEVQLNYFHDNEEWRSMNVMTFVDDRVNYDMKAARNFKWEVRGDISYMGNRLSVTYFREKMSDAFRMATEVRYHTYNRYDTSGYDPSAYGAPTIDRLPYTTETKIAMVSRPTNSSRVDKEGVEFTFSSRRLPVVRTRVTVNGAWFRTTLANSTGLWYKPAIIVNGKELPYAGYYEDPEGSVYQSFNTNFTFDTDIPRLKLNVSLSMQNMWFTTTRMLRKAGVPTKYVGVDGVEHIWNPADASDPYLGQLLRSYTQTAFDERRIPLATAFNIKATKKLWNDRVGIALYVNRLISITPDYELYGAIQRRYTTPYFGMELNLKL